MCAAKVQGQEGETKGHGKEHHGRKNTKGDKLAMVETNSRRETQEFGFVRRLCRRRFWMQSDRVERKVVSLSSILRVSSSVPSSPGQAIPYVHDRMHVCANPRRSTMDTSCLFSYAISAFSIISMQF